MLSLALTTHAYFSTNLQRSYNLLHLSALTHSLKCYWFDSGRFVKCLIYGRRQTTQLMYVGIYLYDWFLNNNYLCIEFHKRLLKCKVHT